MGEQQGIASPVTIFYSYAQEDEKLRSSLEVQLGLLRQQGIISGWYDRQIIAGTDRKNAIDTHLNAASVILLLVSAYFLNSDYCYGDEMKQALARHEAGTALVIPIILRPVDWKRTPFGQLQCLPRNERPVTAWKDRQAAYHHIAQEIRTAIEQLLPPSRPDSHLSPPVSPLPPRVHEEIRDYTWYISEKTRNFVGRDFIFKQIQDFTDKQPCGYFLVRGDPGAGKTALAAQLVKTRGLVHHFNIRSMGIKWTDLFLRNICAQLIAKYKLEGPVPSEKDLRDGGILATLLIKVAQRLQVNETALIVIDALDEVDDASLASGINVLYLPEILPEKIYIIATVRQNAPVKLPIEHHSLYIEPNSPENKADIRKYIEQALTRLGIQAYISAQGITKEAFVDHLEDKSEGNFMYLRYILPDIETGVYNDLKFESLPSGLKGYYEAHWQRMHGTDDEIWFKYKLPVLMALAAAEAPVTIGMIQAFSGVQEPERVTALLEEGQWGQFLHKEEVPSSTQKRYSIYHASFREFLLKKEELKEAGVNFIDAKRRINTFYLSKLRRQGDK